VKQRKAKRLHVYAGSAILGAVNHPLLAIGIVGRKGRGIG